MVEQPQMKKVFAFCIVLEMNSFTTLFYVNTLHKEKEGGSNKKKDRKPTFLFNLHDLKIIDRFYIFCSPSFFSRQQGSLLDQMFASVFNLFLL